MDKLSNELGRLQAEVPLASHYTFLRNPFSCHCAFPWPGLSVRKQAQPSLGIRHLQGRLGLARSPGFRAPSPPRSCGNISQSRYLRSEQTGCEEVLALDAWQEWGPWLPGAWGRTGRLRHTGWSPLTLQTGASCLLASASGGSVPGLPSLEAEEELQVIPGFLWCFSSRSFKRLPFL